MEAYAEITPYRHAPEICVEIVSPSNTKTEMQEKTRAYLDCGAAEVWLVSEAGGIRYFTPDGEVAASGFPLSVSLPPPVK
jgi:Uma2 family endonuclease